MSLLTRGLAGLRALLPSSGLGRYVSSVPEPPRGGGYLEARRAARRWLEDEEALLLVLHAFLVTRS